MPCLEGEISLILSTIFPQGKLSHSSLIHFAPWQRILARPSLQGVFRAKTIVQCTHRQRIRVTGQVQGVGFRPFVWNRATSQGLAGYVRNDSQGVTIEVQGSQEQIDAFLSGFTDELPPLSVVDQILTSQVPYVDEQAFRILPSLHVDDHTTPIAPDIATCDDCLNELCDPANRRHGYPFINCTNCGPRFTIVEQIPYDRALTTMRSFVMCPACQAEYDNPADRRFHAQPNACLECGPQLWFVGSASQVTDTPPACDKDHRPAIKQFAAAMHAGQIVAVKGIGGFHLACDAANPQAVAKLRKHKGRGERPLAVMVRSSEQVESFAFLSDAERRSLEAKERPIVLLKKRQRSLLNGMLESVAPNNDFVGVVLPYSPLHCLLVDKCAPLVMTSGNLADEPIARTNDEAKTRLSDLADGFLLHDREIHSVCDDSVVRHVGSRLLPIRRSRGYAPMPVGLPTSGPSVLAVGGELKATFAITKRNYAYMSQHIGDMANLETLEALEHNVQHFLGVYRASVEAVAGDLHPAYISSQWGRKFADELGVPFIGVQHHEAHAASLIGETQWRDDKPLLICCFDGTGYGRDAAIWGGEFLLALGNQFERVAHLRYFPLPGGDAGIRRPYRAAMSLLRESQFAWNERLPCVAHLPASELGILSKQLSQRLNCADTSSMGRLFDAVASLIGVRQEVDYEAQAAMELEALATKRVGGEIASRYAFGYSDEHPMQVDFQPVVEAIGTDVLRGVDRTTIAAGFHHAVADLVVAVARRMREAHGTSAIGLSGGVFQNALLVELVEARCHVAEFTVLTHTLVPPNDGGLSLGQAILAQARLRT